MLVQTVPEITSDLVLGGGTRYDEPAHARIASRSSEATMNVSRILRAVLLGLCLAAGVRAVFASDDDTLERAKSLYVSADYDEALAVLDRLDSTAAGDDATSIAQYRVFCLLALNRRAEARESIDRILHERPLYMPTDNEASPRIQGIFQDVRREVLPKIVLERYGPVRLEVLLQGCARFRVARCTATEETVFLAQACSVYTRTARETFGSE